MIVITGAAGFIGSSLLEHLNSLGQSEILVVDNLKNPGKWKNLRAGQYADYLDKEDFLDLLFNDMLPEKPELIYHLGACSNTSETDEDYLMHNNSLYTRDLAAYCVENNIRFVYASSAATYGDGSQGYADGVENLENYSPLNAYGYSKHLFDLWAAQNNWFDKIVGLKFFNVFGPREEHKGSMQSLPSRVLPQLRKGQGLSLFRSENDNYKDGEQCRDFIYIDDAVKILVWMGQQKEVNGLFNVGRGEAVTWKTLAAALFKALGQDEKISYVDMPDNLAKQYQYHTCADMTQLRKAGYEEAFLTIEDSVKLFVNHGQSQKNQTHG